MLFIISYSSIHKYLLYLLLMSSLSNLNATHQSPTKSILNYRTISRSGLSRFGGFCLLAGLVTGTNWYVQSKLAQAQ